MKNTLSVGMLLFTFLLVACKKQTTEKTVQTQSNMAAIKPPQAEFAAMQFEKTAHRFGKVEAGAIIKHIFSFKNSGTIPLLINDVVPQCGCTTIDFPKKPLLPNEIGKITLEFDTKNEHGDVEKNARIVANIEGGTLFLFLRGHVKPIQEVVESNVTR